MPPPGVGGTPSAISHTPTPVTLEDLLLEGAGSPSPDHWQPGPASYPSRYRSPALLPNFVGCQWHRDCHAVV